MINFFSAKMVVILLCYGLLSNPINAGDIYPLLPYDWNQALHVPPKKKDNPPGNQILHFNSSNKFYKLNPDAEIFVEKHLKNAQALKSDAEVLHFASHNVSIEGVYLEMGVCTAKTINFIAALNPQKIIRGFDSFEGLPEAWERGDLVIPKGTFAFKNRNFIPAVLHNVELYKGLFKNSLPQFKKNILKDTPIAFLHIDCDIYSSTKDVFDALGDNIIPGTIIVFDELYNYPGCEEHEWKAFNEFLERKDLSVEFLAFNQLHEQVAVKIK